MEAVLFSEVTILDPHSPFHLSTCDVRIRDGRIALIANRGSLSPEAGETVCKGGSVSPGWVDMRTHLTVPGFEYKDDLESLSLAGMAGGYTRLVTMPNTQPVIDNAGQVRSLKLQSADLPIYLHPTGAMSLGAKGVELAEMHDMQLAGAVAFTDGLNSVQSSGLLLLALQYLSSLDGLLIQTPLALSLAGNAEVAEGLSATLVGLKGIPALAEEMGVQRDLLIQRHAKHRIHLGPITTSAAVNILRDAKRDGSNVSVETTAVHLLLDDSELLEFNGNAKVWPPLRNAEDIASLRAGLRDGTIDVISSSHHPQSLEEKQHDFVDAAFGAEMLETAFAAARTAMSGAAELSALIAAFSTNPRRILALPAAGIVEGGLAEITHFDPDMTWVPGLKDLRSKSRNNPLLGRTLQGKPLGVYVKGKYHPVQA